MSKSISSSDQVHTLYHTFFEPKSETKATLLILHGMTEHSELYKDFAQYLANNGIAVLTYDHLGHGRTINNANELGFFEYKYPVQTLLKDVALMAETLNKKHPNLPHFIMGHSMGSFIARNFLQTHSSEFTGAILMGTSDYEPLIKGLLPIAKTLNILQPKHVNHLFANSLHKIMLAKLRLKVSKKEMTSLYSWLSANSECIKQYEEDPLCGFDFTNNGFYALFSLMNNSLAKDWADTIDKDFPMLFLSGQNDPVGNMGKGIKKLTKRLTKQGFSHIEKKLYSDMRHEPLHEVDKQVVYADTLNWINKTAYSN